jgi:hypothetical protein
MLKSQGVDDSEIKLCHSDRSRTLSEAEGDGGVEEPASSRPNPEPRAQPRTARLTVEERRFSAA